MDVEITVDLFHVSFGIINQLRNRKDLTCHWGQQNHSYSPIWASERVLPLQLVRVRESTRESPDEPAPPWMWRWLLTYSMCLLVSLGSSEKTYHGTGANRTTLTHQSGLPREGITLHSSWLEKLLDRVLMNQHLHGCGDGC